MHAHAQNVRYSQWIKTTPRAEGIEVVPETQLASRAETGPSPPQDQRGVAWCAKLSLRLICPSGLPTLPLKEPPTPTGWRLHCEVHGSQDSARLVGQGHSGGEKGLYKVRSDGNLNCNNKRREGMQRTPRGRSDSPIHEQVASFMN